LEIKEGDRVFADFQKKEVIFQTPQLFGKSIRKRERVLTK